VFHLLTRGSPTALPRHQTLRATMDWSYQLLRERERVLLCRLSVFAGGFTTEAIETICAGDGLAEDEILDSLSDLMDKSLITTEATGDRTRNHLLEIVRQYAQEKLIESGEADRVRARHLDYFVRLAEQAPSGFIALEQPAWMMRWQAEHDNLRAALEWSANDQATAQIGLRLVGLVARFLETHGHFVEELEWIKRLLDRAGESALPAWRGDAFFHAAIAEFQLGKHSAARSSAAQAVELFRMLGDRPHIAETYCWLGAIFTGQLEFAQARPVLEESVAIYQNLGDTLGAAWSLSMLGLAVYALGDHDLGRSYLESSLKIGREGNWGVIIERQARFLGDIFRREGDLAQARSLHTEAITSSRAGGVWGLPNNLDSFAYLTLAEGFPRRAAKLFGAADRVFETYGSVRVPFEQAEHDQAVANLQATMGEEAFAA
ncbi:MAG: tetratricopeptide repeat protein, partial [Chloroflexota bacterium]|nr:tetratricopeptide repeat protein [Chloroflexota bacterium]